jgi:hypothetical protein
MVRSVDELCANASQQETGKWHARHFTLDDESEARR